MRNAPAYQEYPADLLANENYAMMSLEERGLFHSIRHHCWVNGSVSSKPDDLAYLVHSTEGQVLLALTERVRAFFDLHPTRHERFISPELENYRKEMTEKSEARRQAGLLSASNRKRPRAKKMEVLQQRVEDAASQAVWHRVPTTPE